MSVAVDKYLTIEKPRRKGRGPKKANIEGERKERKCLACDRLFETVPAIRVCDQCKNVSWQHAANGLEAYKADL